MEKNKYYTLLSLHFSSNGILIYFKHYNIKMFIKILEFFDLSFLWSILIYFMKVTIN